jgi:hypothetical protein
LWVTIRVIVAAFQSQGTATAGSILLYLGRDILIAAFVIASGVTLLFAVWEYLEFKFRYSERWKPESLPPVPACTPQQMRPVARLTGEIVWLLFFAGALFLPQLSWVWGGMGKFSPSDALSAMRLPIWLLALFVFAQSWLNRAHLAAALRPFLRMAFSIAAIALAVWLLRADTLLVPGPNWTPTQAKPLATLNQMLGGVLVLFGVVAGLVFLKELRSSLRKTGRHQPLSSAS